MPRVELTRGAVEDLERLILTHSLPADPRDRIRRSLRPLGHFPRLGAVIDDRRPEERFLIGPWHWLVIVYEYRDADGRIVILSIEDGRSAKAVAARPAK